jgi:hypothetical protein
MGIIHTNTIEGFWLLVKHGVVGTFHKVSRKYMLLYVSEIEFWNKTETARISSAR